MKTAQGGVTALSFVELHHAAVIGLVAGSACRATGARARLGERLFRGAGLTIARAGGKSSNFVIYVKNAHLVTPLQDARVYRSLADSIHSNTSDIHCRNDERPKCPSETT